jgi:putative acetyltransferase
MGIAIEHAAAATPEVHELVSALDEALAALYTPDQRHGLALDQLFAPGVRFFLARLDGVAAGCGGVAFARDHGEVKRMYTRPGLRGRGVAKALLNRLETEARAAGLALLRLETGIHQPEAIALYERSGFHRCSPFGPYADMPAAAIALSLFFEKPLAG